MDFGRLFHLSVVAENIKYGDKWAERTILLLHLWHEINDM